MRLDDLRFFMRVAALSNLSAAGREFGLSPSAASSRLSTLERDAGARLLNRTTRTVVLTEAGQMFLSHAVKAIAQMDEAMANLEASAQTPSGLLRISSNVFFAHKHVLPYLTEFRETYPNVRIVMNCTDKYVDILAEGYDLAIRAGRLPDSTLKVRRLGSNRRVLCASPAYIKRKGEPLSPADLASHDCIGVSNIPVWYFDGPDGEVGYEVPEGVGGDSGDFSYEAALHGVGLCIKSIAHVWQDLRDGRLVKVMPEYPVAREGSIWAVMPPGQQTPSKVSAFVDFLISKLGKTPYWESDYHLACAPEAGQSGTTQD